MQAESPTDFSSLLKDSIDKVNDAQRQANKLAQAFETGETDASLAEVMISLQKASVSFQAMVQVHHAGDTIEPETVEVVLVQPEPAV